MPPDQKSVLRFEIGHVLFIDLVGYSKLLIDEQRERLRPADRDRAGTEQVREAANEQLVRLADRRWDGAGLSQQRRRSRRNVRSRLRKRSRRIRRLRCGWEFTAGR